MIIHSNSNIKNNINCITNRYYIIKCLNHANNENHFDLIDKYPYVIDFILCMLTLYAKVTFRIFRGEHINNTINYELYTDYRSIYIDVYINMCNGSCQIIVDFTHTDNSTMKNQIIKQFTDIVKDTQYQINTTTNKVKFTITQ